MPAAVQVKVVGARDLPIMDRSSELTDAFVEVPHNVMAWLGPKLAWPCATSFITDFSSFGKGETWRRSLQDGSVSKDPEPDVGLAVVQV